MRALWLLLLLSPASRAEDGDDRPAVYCSGDKEISEACGDLPNCGPDQAGTKYEKHCAHVRNCHEGHGALKVTCVEIAVSQGRVDMAKADVSAKLPPYVDTFLGRDGTEPTEKAFKKAVKDLTAAEAEEEAAINKLQSTYETHFQTAENLSATVEEVERSYPPDGPEPPGPDGGGPNPRGPRGSAATSEKIKKEAAGGKDKAAQKIAQAKAAQAKSAEASQAYKTALGGKGNAKEAAAAKGFLDQTLKTNPNDVMARRLRALDSFRNGDCAGAASDAAALLTADPNDQKAAGIYNLCRGKTPGASPSMLASAKTAFGNPPGEGGGFSGTPQGGFPAGGAGTPAAGGSAQAPDPAPFLAQAFSALKTGNFNAALAAGGWALDLDPRNPAGWAVRAMANNGLRDYKAAIRDADEGLKLAPGDPRLLKLKAFAQNRTKDYVGALATADLAIQADPTNADGYVHRAFAQGGLGDRKGMLASLRMAANFDPRYHALLEEALRMQGGTAPLELLFGGDDRPAAAPLPAIDKPLFRGPPSGARLWLAAGGAGLVMVVVAVLLMRRFSQADEEGAG